MANLLWKTKNSTKKLLSTPFSSEEEFDKFVFETPEILEDIFLLRRQIKGGNKPGIPDIVGIDNDSNVCIIEMKNKKVDSSIIPQVLEYAIWADTNPDSIKSLWYEKEDKPEDLEIDWDKLQVRIIVIAPEILPSALQSIDKINFEVELLEINRWSEKENQLILIHKLERDSQNNKVKVVRGLTNYTKETYKKYRNKQSVDIFYKYISEVEQIIKKKGWNLETKFNKYNCSFKAGFFFAFRIVWVGSKSLAFSIGVDKSQANKFKPKMKKYRDKSKRAVYYIEPGKTKTADFIPLFELAYKKLTGE
jgi:hypothetical protein